MAIFYDFSKWSAPALLTLGSTHYYMEIPRTEKNSLVDTHNVIKIEKECNKKYLAAYDNL